MSQLNEQPDAQWLLYAAAEDATFALESERRHLATMLDSNVIEPLILLLSQATIYERTIAPQARTALSVLTSLARQTLQQARDLEATLHPTILETLGLEPALETLVSTSFARMASKLYCTQRGFVSGCLGTSNWLCIEQHKTP